MSSATRTTAEAESHSPTWIRRTPRRPGPHGFYLQHGHRRATPFILEAELAIPVTAWLQGAGYRVEPEVAILGRRADLVGARDDALVAIELKMHDWREALRQAVAYQLAADRVWVAMPLPTASAAYRGRWRFEAERVGLLAVDDRGCVRVPIPAGLSPRLLPFLRERVRMKSTPGAWGCRADWVASSDQEPPVGSP